jgi:hypothetical protein
MIIPKCSTHSYSGARNLQQQQRTNSVENVLQTQSVSKSVKTKSSYVCCALKCESRGVLLLQVARPFNPIRFSMHLPGVDLGDVDWTLLPEEQEPNA